MAHQLPGDAGSVSSIKYFLLELRDCHVLVCTGSTAVVSYINHQGCKSAFATPVQAGTPDPWVVPGQTPLAENSSYSWASEYGSRHPIEVGAEAWGMDSSPEVVKQTWRALPGSGGPACDSRDAALSPMVVSIPSSSMEAGCQGIDVAEASSVHLSPIALLLGILQRVRRTGKRAHFWLISLLDGSLIPS